MKEDDFADMYAQTIAYGLLSARVSRPAGLVPEDMVLMVPPTNPFLKELMETFLHVGGRKRQTDGAIVDFDELGINEVIETLRDANMEAVLRDFDNRNPQEDPVIHFYELFLKEYDPKRRMQRGVFYTPKPVVSYIVRSVHELLQTEFGLEDGLASTVTWREMAERFPCLAREEGEAGRDPETTKSGIQIPEGTDPDSPFVTILDPATGTATFLVEVIDVIHRTLTDKWKRERLTPAQQKDAWNQYVPRHLLPRVFGYELMMAPYAIAHMKIGLKLGETGYRFRTKERARVYLTNALEPWARQLGLIGFEALAHEAAAVNEVKRYTRFTVVIGNPPYSIVSQNGGTWITSLMETYKHDVRTERNIQPLSDDYLKFLRLGQFSIETARTGVLSLITNHTYLSGIIHRGVRRTLLNVFRSIEVLDLHGSALLGLLSPTGQADKNVFDIQQGVSIVTCAVCPSRSKTPSLARADLWGQREYKYRVLTGTEELPIFSPVEPTPPYFFYAISKSPDEAYRCGVSVADLFEQRSAGFVTGRDEALISFQRQDIADLVDDLANSHITDDDIASRYRMSDTSGWPVSRRRKGAKHDRDRHGKIRRVAYRPFDDRFTFYSDFLQRSRLSVFRHLLKENVALITSRLVKGEQPAHFFVSRLPVEKIFLSPKTSNNAFVFPLYCYPLDNTLDKSGRPGVGISPSWASYIANLLHLVWSDSRIKDETNVHTLHPEELLGYAYAVFHSPEYRSRYAEFLKIDFPRLPLTGSLDLFRALSRLGGELVALHLLESPKLAQASTEYIGSPNAEVEKISWSNETVWVDKKQTIGFRGVPEPVWKFYIGGYQVCHKWLKDRKGRTLSKDDIAHYQKIVVALSETIRLMAEIDETIDRYGGWPGAFVTDSPVTGEVPESAVPFA